MSDKNIYYLHELSDYKVASDYPDVRGWDMKDASNRTVGTIDNLLVNKNAQRVVYLDVEVDQSIIEDGHEPLSTPASDGVHEFINKDGENHLIVPIGLVDIDEENKTVISKHISGDTFLSAKRFKKGTAVEPGYELILHRHYFPDSDLGDQAETNDDFYLRNEFKHQR